MPSEDPETIVQTVEGAIPFFPKAESQNKAEESISQKYLLLHADCKDSSSWPSQMNKPTLEMYEGR